MSQSLGRTLQNDLLILGFGGHARSVGDIALQAGFQELLFLDDKAQDGEGFSGFPAVRILPSKNERCWHAFPAAGDNGVRERQCFNPPFPLTTLVSPSASVATEVSLGLATFVARQAHIGPCAQIGQGVILNTGCVVEHECQISDFAHISVNSTVAGRSKIGRRVLIGAGAVVIDGVSVCDDVVIGAGAVVVSDIDQPGKYLGIPARRISLAAPLPG